MRARQSGGGKKRPARALESPARRARRWQLGADGGRSERAERVQRAKQFEASLSALNLPLPGGVFRRCLRLFRLLEEWRGAGLTGFRTPDQAARLYFAEAFALDRFLPAGGPFVDIGSGGGTPALPLALADASRAQWTLLEPRRIAAGFLEIAASELGLTPRIRVVRRRLGDFLNRPSGRCAVFEAAAVTLRAVRLGRSEWTQLASALSPQSVVVWPTTRAARKTAAIRSGLFAEQQFPADRGVVWLGRKAAAPGGGTPFPGQQAVPRVGGGIDSPAGSPAAPRPPLPLRRTRSEDSPPIRNPSPSGSPSPSGQGRSIERPSAS